jgi:hypothetical protein
MNYPNPPVLCGMTLTWSGPSEFGSPDQFILFGGGADRRQLYNSVYILTVDLNEPNGTTTVWHEPTIDPSTWPPPREFQTAWLDDAHELHIFGGYDYGYCKYSLLSFLSFLFSSPSFFPTYLPTFLSSSPLLLPTFLSSFLPFSTFVLSSSFPNFSSFVPLHLLPPSLFADYFNDTWQFNNFNHEPTWVELLSSHPPPPSRCSNAVAYSISSDEALIWGGRDATNQVLDDMWVFYRGNWTEVRPTTDGPTPLGRFGMVSGYFEEQNAMVIWGGMSENGTLLSDTWYFSFQDI